MKILLASTEDYIKRDRTQLTAAATAGSSVVLAVSSKENIAVNDFIVVGAEGTYTAELCQVSTVTETSITVTTLLNAHSVDESIIKYRFNQRKFYGSLTGVAGTFSQLSSYGSPVNISVTDPQGTYLEYTGSEGYTYFLATYYNSTTLDETLQSDSITMQSGESTRYCSLFEIRKQAGLVANPYIDDGRIEAKRKQAENEVNSSLIARYLLPLQNAAGANEIPGLIERIACLLGAGYLDYEEYGSAGQGVKWLGEARGILAGIQKGTQRLIDSTGAEFKLQSASSNVWSDASETGGNQPYFTRGQIF